MFCLAKTGFLPAKFCKLNNKPPPCVSCAFGQAHKKPWLFKKTKDGAESSLRGKQISEPGDTVGVDQLISAQPGLVPQSKGVMTRACIWAATIFVDYVTGLVYVGLMTDQPGDSIIQCKHEDNGRFAERSFTDDVKRQFQQITFCSVGAHH